MKPGTILTNYKIMKSENEINFDSKNYNLNEFIEMKKAAQKESIEIIDAAKKNAILEKKSIINRANLLLEETLELKENIENNYEENLRNTYNLNIEDFIKQKNEEFLLNIEKMNAKFDDVFEKAKEDICDILLKSFKDIFGTSYDDTAYIKELLLKNFVGFEDCKNIELVLSQNAFDKFTHSVKEEYENDLNIVFNSIKADKNLNGVIVKTDLGTMEVNLDNQIEILKENLKTCLHSK